MTIGRLLAASALCAPLLLAGCSDDPEPKIAPPTSSPSSSAASPEPTPEPWEKKSDDGAVAFAARWFEVFSEAMNSGNSDQVRELSTSNCVACSTIADQIDAIAAAGGFTDSEGWSVLSTSEVQKASEDEVLMSVRVLQGAERFKPDEDAAVDRNPAQRTTYSARLQWRDGRWRVADLRVLT